MLRTMLISILIAACSCASCVADMIDIGTSNSGTSSPFFGALKFQQIYNSSLFPSGPISISSISFFRSSGSKIDNTDYTVSVSTTSMTAATLVDTFASNHGASVHTFFSGKPPLTGYTGTDPVVFAGSSFVYDPSFGSLLVEIVKFSNPTSGTDAGDLSVHSDSLNSAIKILTSDSDGPTGNLESKGLVTRLTYTAVPEPSAAILLLTASGLILQRRSKTRTRR